MSPTSLALNNLRAFVILIVLAFHSRLAYLYSLPASAFPFDEPPYKWLAFPIIDSHRWLGFDLFCAFQDVYLMSFMFLLSGLFVWPSLVSQRKREISSGPPDAAWLAVCRGRLPAGKLKFSHFPRISDKFTTPGRLARETV